MLLRCFRNELKRALRHKLLFLGVLMSFAALYVGLQVFYQPYRVFPPPAHPFNLNAFQAWQSSLFGPFPLLAPLVCCLGGVDSLVVDRRDGFARAVLLRAPYRVYITSKIAATAVVGALAIAVPMTAFFGYLCLTYPAALPPLEQFGVFENLPPGQIGGLLGTIFYSHPFAYVGLSILLAGAFGAVYAVLGLSMAAYTDNRYIATAAPFVVFVCGIVIFGAILRVPRWSPVVPLAVTAVQQPTWTAALVPLLVLLLFSGVSLFIVQQRTAVRFPF